MPPTKFGKSQIGIFLEPLKGVRGGSGSHKGKKSFFLCCKFAIEKKSQVTTRKGVNKIIDFLEDMSSKL